MTVESNCNEPVVDRICGAMFGVAVGDALGATLEFMNRQEICDRYGTLVDMVGGGWLSLKPGEVTDDTEMTIAVANGIIEDPEAPVSPVGRRFVEWFQSNPPDIGNTVRISIANFLGLGSWESASEATRAQLGDNSAGNGALMRTIPISLAYGRNRSTMVRISKRVALMTHPQIEAEAASIIYNEMARLLLNGKDKKGALEGALELTRDDYGETESWVRSSRIGSRQYDELVPTGYVVNTLEASVWCLLNSKGFEEAVVSAVNLGEDSDTTGAVTGGLAGVHYGYGSIPERWLNSLSDSNRARIWAACDGLRQVALQLR